MEPDHVVMGSRGAWLAPERRKMIRIMKPVAPRVTVLSDVVTAWMGAFNELPRSRRGVLIISGTGSVAYGQFPDGRGIRAGGLGPVKGDEGSGFWIGDQWKAGKRPLTPTIIRRTAAQTPQVWAAARRGNVKAQQIILDAQVHLAKILIELHRRLRWRGVYPVAFSGSIFSNPGFPAGVMRHLRQQGIRVKAVSMKHDAALAAARSIIVRHADR